MESLEIWKDIEGYDGIYQVSNLGNVRSVERIVNTPVPKSDEMFKRRVPGVLLNPTRNKQSGYMIVTLYKGSKNCKHSVHRLVANAFIENPEHKKCVNHKDYDRTNNRLSNLEWVTHKENALYSRERMSIAHLKKKDAV